MWDTQGDGIEAGRRVLDDGDAGIVGGGDVISTPRRW